MSTILFNNPLTAIKNAVNHYKLEYLNEEDKTKWNHESHYVKRQIASKDGAIYTHKSRKKPGRPPKRWYWQITANDVYSIQFRSVEDKIAFVLK